MDGNHVDKGKRTRRYKAGGIVGGRFASWEGNSLEPEHGLLTGKKNTEFDLLHGGGGRRERRKETNQNRNGKEEKKGSHLRTGTGKHPEQ